MGRLIRDYEGRLVLDMVGPQTGENILDAGCGTGIFTTDMVYAGADVVALDPSLPMLSRARQKMPGPTFRPVLGDMTRLPFKEAAFDKAVSVTALEFIPDVKRAVEELFRVTRPAGRVVVATLNKLSPWNRDRAKEGAKGHSLFRHAVFRSPEEVLALSPVKGLFKTAIHFSKHDDPETAKRIEEEAQAQGINTGTFLMVSWIRPENPVPYPVPGKAEKPHPEG